MTEYIKLEDAINKFIEGGQTLTKDQIIYLLNRIPKADRKFCFKEVYDYLSEISLFMGRYDALHGDEHFMYGVNTAMEVIANNAGVLDEYAETWAQNMIDSEERALVRAAEREHALVVKESENK